MAWFRRHHSALCRLCMAVWLMAFACTLWQGCQSAMVSMPPAMEMGPSLQHAQMKHHELCVSLCQDAGVAAMPSHAKLPGVDLLQLVLVCLLFIPLVLLSLPVAHRVVGHVRGPPCPQPPVRFRFVRFNH